MNRESCHLRHKTESTDENKPKPNLDKRKKLSKRILADSLLGKINLIEDVIIKPHGIVPVHKHKFTDEIFYITENSAFMIVNDKKFKVKPGDFIYVEKNENHGFRNESNQEFKMIVFKINFKKGDSYLKD